jgi:prepilin-type N-terminal cleavage/methylation domain-containing protein
MIRAFRKSSAFTLIELMVVLVIIAISAVISIPRITTGIEAAKFRHAVSEAVSFLRSAHLDALLERKDIIVTINYEDNILKRNDDQLFNIPLDIVLNSEEIDDSQLARYTFYNNGRGSGPKMKFLGNHERKATVYVDLISGLAKYELN